MMSSSANSTCTIITQQTTEEGDSVAEHFGCVIIVLIKLVDQDIIEFSSCFSYIRQTVEFLNAMYVYIYIYIHICCSLLCYVDVDKWCALSVISHSYKVLFI